MKSFQGLAHFQAKIKRAGVLMKMGRLDEAHIDAENVLRKEPKNEEAHKIYSMIEPVNVSFLGAGGAIFTGASFTSWPVLAAFMETATVCLCRTFQFLFVSVKTISW